MRLSCLFLASILLAGCSAPAPAPKPQIRPTLQTTGVPVDVAECITRQARAAGLVASVRPLYGYDHVAVDISQSVAGDQVGWLLVGRRDGMTRIEPQGDPAKSGAWKEDLLKLAQGC